jgi:hypothetical protein
MKFGMSRNCVYGAAIGICVKEDADRTLMTQTGADHRGQN